MSATELDLPVLASADQIRRREFVTTRRGYDPDQVREFLERVAVQVQQMEAMIREARLEAESALRASVEPRIDPYEQLSARFTDVIRAADEAAERVHRESREDAERMISEARADADRIRTDAQSKAEEARASADRALREARDQADRTIAGLSTRREALVGQLAHMQARLLGVAEQLESAIEIRDEVDADPIVIGEAEVRDELFSVPGAEAASSARSEPGATILPSDEELWDGTEAIALEVPDIPALDLLWGDDDEDD
ncbi:MAG: DivIVA domain-containing protein [Actinomycetota bacterium]